MRKNVEDSHENQTKIGIVIPAWNEEKNLEECLTSLKPFLDAGDNICVVNAASTDGTYAQAQLFDVTVIQSDQPSRSKAIQLGIAQLTHQNSKIDVIIIAHADMKFVPESRQTLCKRIKLEPEKQWGAFGHSIDDDHFIYRFIEKGNSFRARYCGLVYGDQAQFIRTQALDEIGGFPTVETLEDLELTLRMRKLSPALYLDCPVTIPNRHWSKGIILTTVRNWLTLMSYWFKRRLII